MPNSKLETLSGKTTASLTFFGSGNFETAELAEIERKCKE